MDPFHRDTFRIRIDNLAGRTMVVESGQSVLEAALEAGVPWPHGCRAGRCGTCKSRVFSGDFDLRDHSRFALSAEERAAGLVLACRALPRSDGALRWLGRTGSGAGPVRQIATVAEILDPVPDVRILRLHGPALDFVPGQYARLTLPGAPVRDYSMANQPGASLTEFHIRRIPGGAASGRPLTTLAPGQKVSIEGPFGACHLHEDFVGPLICVAGGTGAAPILSIVEAALRRQMPQPIRVFLGAVREQDFYCRSRFEALAGEYDSLDLHFVADNADRGTMLPGRIVRQIAEMDIPLDGWRAYVAGPPPLVEAATNQLVENGCHRKDVFADAFFTPELPYRQPVRDGQCGA